MYSNYNTNRIRASLGCSSIRDCCIATLLGKLCGRIIGLDIQVRSFNRINRIPVAEHRLMCDKLFFTIDF